MDSKEVIFAISTHAQVVAALAAERVDWRTLTWAGWPQLPYEELCNLKELPPTPVDELKNIRDPKLRKDALRARREYDEVRTKELQEAAEE